MANLLPPIPQDEIKENPRWREWFRNLGNAIQQAQTGGIVWPITNGGTGATTASGARANLGLGSMAVQNSDNVYISGGIIKPSAVITGYGAFQNTADQTFAAANTPTKIVVNTTDYIRGMSRSGSTITDITAGIYNLQYSLQLANTSSTIREIEIWLRKNGIDVPGTTTKFAITTKHGSVDGYTVPVANYFINLAPTDTVELWAAVSDTSLYIEAYAAQTTPYARPSIPSTVITLSQVA